MIGVLVATHGLMAKGMLDSVTLLAGEQQYLDSMCLQASDNADEFQNEMKKKIDKLDTGSGVLVFVDILGGTPCNKALKLAACSPNIEVVTGVNLPVLLGSLMGRLDCSSLSEVIENIQIVAKDSVKVASAQLRGAVSDSDDLDLDME